MLKKRALFISIILSTLQGNFCLGQSLIISSNSNINDTVFTQNIHFCIYKLAEQYEYYYMAYPTTCEELLKSITDPFPELCINYLEENAPLFDFLIRDDTLFAYYNCNFFGYYYFEPYWKSPNGENGNASLYQVTLFYDSTGLIMCYPDSIRSSFEYEIRNICKSFYIQKRKKALDNESELFVNCKYVFFEYKQGSDIQKINTGVNSENPIIPNPLLLRKIKRIARLFCKEQKCNTIRFSCPIYYTTVP